MITSPAQADQIVRSGHADLVLLAREFLRESLLAAPRRRGAQPEDHLAGAVLSRRTWTNRSPPARPYSKGVR